MIQLFINVITVLVFFANISDTVNQDTDIRVDD